MEKNRQLLILFVAIVILSLVGVLFFFANSSRGDKKKPATQVAPTRVWYSPSPVRKITVTPTIYIPTGKKIEIEGLEVNDIYAKPLLINDLKDVKFAGNENFEFVYLPRYHKFIITILGSPFLPLIKPAEEDFIKVLGITREQACGLNVDITTVAFANPDYAGKRFFLSFCNK